LSLFFEGVLSKFASRVCVFSALKMFRKWNSNNLTSNLARTHL